MRAAVMRNREIVVDTVPDPVPGPGQVLVKTLACGICGSDLHALRHADHLADTAERSGVSGVMDPSADVVMGHEFCAEIVEHGPDAAKTLAVGTRVCSMPFLIGATGLSLIGYSNDVPGGYGELMVLNEGMLLEVPDDMSTEVAALTEPMAVGAHAVAKARLGPEDLPLVIGCGPVGLAIIASLKRAGAAPVIAADFSPMRRALAEKFGADIVVDPAEQSPYETWSSAGVPEGFDPLMALMGAGPKMKPAVIFECVGVPGILQQVFEGAPKDTRIVVAGVCMEQDRIEPFFAINKELNVQFVLGYQPDEFTETLADIANGKLCAEPMITGKIDLDGVPAAFDDLASPERHAKVIVEPWR